MSRTVSATEARIHLGKLLDGIERHEGVTVEQAGIAKIVVIPVNEAEQLSSEPARSADWRRSMERARMLITRDLGDRPVSLLDILLEAREERDAEPYDPLC